MVVVLGDLARMGGGDELISPHDVGGSLGVVVRSNYPPHIQERVNIPSTQQQQQQQRSNTPDNPTRLATRSPKSKQTTKDPVVIAKRE